MNLDQRAWNKASNENKTLHPTTAQVQECYQELLEEIYDEKENYYNQDGCN